MHASLHKNKFSVIGYKLLRRSLAKLVYLISQDHNRDPLRSVLLLGSARSGTTWLAQNISDQCKLRLVFEPFTSTQNSRWSLPDRTFVAPECENKQINTAIEQILNGSIKNRWTDQFNLQIWSNKRIIKEVRCNLLIPYLIRFFPETNILFLTRHPFDVATSRMKLGWNDHLDTLLVQNEFMNRYYPDIKGELKKLRDPMARQIAFWCLENCFILNSELRQKLQIITYSRLLDSSEITLDYPSIDLNETITLSDQPSQSSSLKTRYLELDRGAINHVIRLFKMKSWLPVESDIEFDHTL